MPAIEFRRVRLDIGYEAETTSFSSAIISAEAAIQGFNVAANGNAEVRVESRISSPTTVMVSAMGNGPGSVEALVIAQVDSY